jgi:sigma-B regulation protein RsbU (phosphoserine phosphatase)
MSSKPAKTIALLTDTLNSEYTQLLATAVSQEADRRGLAVITFAGGRLGAPVTLEAAQNRVFDLVTSQRVDGVISLSATLGHFVGTEGLGDFLNRFHDIPTCSVGLAIPNVPSLVVDNTSGMAQAVKHLVEYHDRKRIAFIAGPEASPESRQRLAGYRQVLEDNGIPFDEALIEHGEFTMPSGRAAMRRLMARKVPFDAVVAANDYMALATIEVLRSAGLRVPEDISVSGFDDVNAAACATPSLTSLRQPLWQLGGQAVKTLVDVWEGGEVPPCTNTPLTLIVRESCGCQHCVPPTESRKRRDSLLEDLLRRHNEQIQMRLKPLVQVPNEALGAWPQRIMDAVAEELESPGKFLPAFDHLLADAQHVGVNLSEFQRVITELRRSLQMLEEQGEGAIPEHLWHQARIQCCDRAVQMLGRRRIEEQQTIALLGRSGERLATSLSIPRLREVLSNEFPALGIQAAAVSLTYATSPEELTPLLLLRDGSPLEPPTDYIPAIDLAPDEVFETTHDNPSPHRVTLPLTFEAEFLGVAVLDTQCITSLYSALRQQMGAAFKGAYLHRQVIEQIAVRERFERERLLEAARLASELQTSLTPVNPAIPGLEIAARLMPAAESGGDYYDVLDTASGAWLGIGDVTGHGLNAGIIMLMLQSMVGSLVHLNPDMPPADVVIAVNRALYQGIRERLKRDDHATLLLLKYTPDGKCVFAGAHEPPIVYRAATDTCEILEPDGFWVGAIPDITPQTRNTSFELKDGDLLVLYTDGLVEPRNAHNEQFGIERLTDHIRRFAKLPVGEVLERLFEAAKEWSNDWTDDVTVMVVRYRPTS